MERKGRLTEEQLEALEKGAAPVGEVGWRYQPGPLDLFVLRGQDEAVHLYASRVRGEAILAALDSARQDIPRLVAEVRRLRAEVEAASRKPVPISREGRGADESAPAVASRRPPGLDIPEDEPISLAAPFRVGAKEQKAAKDDPLVALAVQVAKALQSDAREIERARLIAMAFAAARGDTAGFWAARNQRSAKAMAGGAAKKK